MRIHAAAPSKLGGRLPVPAAWLVSLLLLARGGACLAGGGPFVTPWPTDDPGLSRAERRELQELLTKRGYDVGTPDGAIGNKTREAIADYQRKLGRDADGRASSKVLAALRQGK